jgi:hypothetical protein
MSTRHMGSAVFQKRDFRLIFPALLLLGCSPSALTPAAFCTKDGDCKTGESCIADLTLGVSYCGLTCVRDADCPEHQSCHTGIRSVTMNEETRVCVDRVRMCGDAEQCNGLDDDCDGVVDGQSCAPITGCLDDRVCGVFACTPAENQPLAICAPKNDRASVEDYAPCTSGDQCRNGVCDTGTCSPLCRPSIQTNSCLSDFACARGVGSGSRPAYNACQKTCDTSLDCTQPQECVWRDVYQGGDDHGFVCAKPDPGRLPLGSACPENSAAGDDQCGHGLCFGRICTRACNGPDADCSDVLADGVCSLEELRYGTIVYQSYLCVRSGT